MITVIRQRVLSAIVSVESQSPFPLVGRELLQIELGSAYQGEFALAQPPTKRVKASIGMRT